MNTPSISGALSERQTTFKRTVTAVLREGYRSSPVRFTAKALTDQGSRFKVDVWPLTFEVFDGDQVDVYITITYDNTPLNTPQTGQVDVCQLAKGWS